MKMQNTDSKVLLLSHSFGQSHPIHKFLKDFSRQVEAGSGSSIKVEIYDSSQLGAEPQFLEQMRLGILDGGIVSNQTLAKFSFDFPVLQYPYIFQNEQSARQFLNIAGEAHLKKKLESSNANLTLCCSLTNGIHGLYFTENSDHFISGKDSRPYYFAGNSNAVYKDFFSLLGLISVPVAKGEVYSALQMGMLQTGENTLPGLIGSKHHETAKFFISTDHSVAIFYFVLNTPMWASLTPQERNLFVKAWSNSKIEFEKKSGTVDNIKIASRNNIIFRKPSEGKLKEWKKYAKDNLSNKTVPWDQNFYKQAETFGEKEK